MASRIARLFLLVVLLGIVGCGTVSDIKPSNPAVTADFDRYSKVVVVDFRNEVPTDEVKPEERAAYREQVDIAARNFADRIAGEIRKTAAFASVVREPVDTSEDAIRITGAIRRYVEGNAFLRFFIGMGAGSSYFDATVDIFDNRSGEKLGTIVADKNSWALGGGIAAGQTVEKMMQSAAEKTAEELAKHRLSPPAPSP